MKTSSSLSENRTCGSLDAIFGTHFTAACLIFEKGSHETEHDRFVIDFVIRGDGGRGRGQNMTLL
jgi:hypothetical protein